MAELKEQTKEIVEIESSAEIIVPDEDKNNGKHINKKKTIVAILLFAMLISIFVAPFIVNKLHIIQKSEEILNSKKNSVVVITSTAVAVSVAVAAMPGDSTTPLANQIAELDIFFIIILIAIYLLKVLLIASISLSFRVLIPIACLLGIAYCISNKNYFKNLAVKILSFGLIIFLTVPVSVATMNIVDTALRTQEKVETVTIEEVTPTEERNDSSNSDKSWLGSFWDDVTTKTEEVTDAIVNTTKNAFQEAKNAFSNLIDIIASLVITCCVIPLLVILFLVWILKAMFGVNIPIKKSYNGVRNTLHRALTKTGIAKEDE